jgi:hypothetical protein
VYQLRLRLQTVGVFFASRGWFSVMTVVCQLRPTLLESVKVDKVISSEKGKDLLVITGFRIRFQNNSC